MNKDKRTRILFYAIGLGLCGSVIALGLYAAQIAASFSQTLVGVSANDSDFIGGITFIGVLVYASPAFILGVGLIALAFFKFLSNQSYEERAQ